VRAKLPTCAPCLCVLSIILGVGIFIGEHGCELSFLPVFPLLPSEGGEYIKAFGWVALRVGCFRGHHLLLVLCM
jgi:hypothetical protein